MARSCALDCASCWHLLGQYRNLLYIPRSRKVCKHLVAVLSERHANMSLQLTDAYEKYAESAPSAASLGRNTFGTFLSLASYRLFQTLGFR